VPELGPHPGEPIINKTSSGFLWRNELHRILLARGVTHVFFAGVNTELDYPSPRRSVSLTDLE
jgi:nicotinamidase-related amidase